MDVPVLHTDRLVLRGRTIADFPSFQAMWTDPGVMRFIGKPFSREEAWIRFARMAGVWALTGAGFWVIEEKATGRLAGEAGFADFKRDIAPPMDGKPEFGWMLAGWAQGRGYATEAARAALDYARAKFPDATMTCMVSEANAPSLRVAQRLGFKEVVRALYKGEPMIVFERPPLRECDETGPAH